MHLIDALLFLLVLSRVLGELAARYGQPAMLGEILAGILLGPSGCRVVAFTPEIKAIADLGVLLLVFLAGMEMDPRALWRSVRGRNAWVSACGFVVPVAGGALVGRLFGLDATRTIFISLCVAITALPVSVRILIDLGQLHSDVGQRIVSSAIANDIASLLALGVVLQMTAGGGSGTSILTAMALALTKALLFMAVAAAAARVTRRYALARGRHPLAAIERLLRTVRSQESLFAVTLLVVMAFATFSQALGLDFVVGAFFGAMLLSHEVLGRPNFEAIQQTASSVTVGFLGPVFFAAIGLEFDVSSLRDWRLVGAVLVVSFAGKILGGYLGGRLARLSRRESWAIGVGLNGRGVMELVIANIALANGFIGRQLFTSLVLMAVATTFATPVLLKRAYTRLLAGQSARSPTSVAS